MSITETIRRDNHPTLSKMPWMATEPEEDLRELEVFLLRLRRLLDRHPEWRWQKQPERMQNILQALLKL